MSRLISAKLLDQYTTITPEFVSKVEKGIESILRSLYKSYEITDNQTTADNILKMRKSYEFPEKGAALLTVVYNKVRGNKLDDFLINIDLIGNDELWRLGSVVAKKIKEYLVAKNLTIERNEIKTNEGTKFITGARYSDSLFYTEGVSLVDESPYFIVPEPHWFRLRRSNLTT